MENMTWKDLKNYLKTLKYYSVEIIKFKDHCFPLCESFVFKGYTYCEDKTIYFNDKEIAENISFFRMKEIIRNLIEE